MRGQGRSIGLQSAAIALLGACLLVLTISTGTAAGHKVRFATKVDFTASDTETTTEFSGTVSSRKRACVVGRKVRMFADLTLLGVATTSEGGSWSLSTARLPGGVTLVAVAPHKPLVKRRGHLHSCASSARL